MRRHFLALCILSVVVGCGDRWHEVFEDLDRLKDKMCACKDKACVDGVKKEVEAWTAKAKDEVGKGEELPEKLAAKGEAISNEMKACRKAVEAKDDEAKTVAMLAKMTAFKDQMCACKDSACATKVSDDLKKWGEDQPKSKDALPKGSEEEMKKFSQIGDDMRDCMKKAMTPPTP